MLLNGVEDLIFNHRVVKIKLFIPAYLNCNLFSRIFDIKAFHYLPKSSLINNVTNLIPIPKLLSNTYSIIALCISNLLQGMPSVTTNRKYLFKLEKFSFLKHGKLISEPSQGI